MPYGCSLDDLLAILHDRDPEKAGAVALQHRRIEHGLLSVGLKIHHLGRGRQFSSLLEGLGGASKVLGVNMYRHAQASLCLVLPPVGSARAAILLLECIERFTGDAVFGNRKIQLQVCSPGRLDASRSALLAIGFYLGSDTLRRYAYGDLETTASEGRRYQRGQRLVIYDAGGEFDRRFEWWGRSINGERHIRVQLPFKDGRSDLLIGSGSKLDIENINLLATLLIHAEYNGYLRELGEQFEEEMHCLLSRHLLDGLVRAPWVRTDDPESADDIQFFSALQELVAYGFDESVRVKKRSGMRFPRRQEMPVTSSEGILYEMQALLEKYRTELVRQSTLHDKGDRS